MDLAIESDNQELLVFIGIEHCLNELSFLERRKGREAGEHIMRHSGHSVCEISDVVQG